MRKRKSDDIGRMLDLQACMEYVGLGRNSARKFAEEANAVVYVGRRVLFDRHKLDAAIDRMTTAV